MLDTNIFVAAVRAPTSASRQLLDAVTHGKATLLISPPVFREYQHILPKAVQSHEREQIIRQWISRAEPVDADRGPRVVPDDSDDDKFVALALQGQADAIVSNDEHLLGLKEKIDVPVLRPADAVERLKPS